MPHRKGRTDIIAKVFLYPTERGGRELPLPTEVKPSFIVDIRGALFSGFILTSEVEREIKPGDTVIVPMVFLDPTTPKAMLNIGDRFVLKEGRVVGEGEVQEIIEAIPEEQKKEWLRKLKEEDPTFPG